jgi:ribonuclease J
MSALTRMAVSTHKQIDIKKGDTVIISASPIPGNEKMISKMIDELFRRGANVIYKALAEVHVSGHACEEELKIIHTLIRAKLFMPVHGEYRHLVQHAKLAHSLGMAEENIFILDNGDVLDIEDDKANCEDSVPSGNILVDGLGVGDVGNIVLRDRRHLSEDGLIIIVITLEAKTNKILSGPDVVSRGFVYVRESEEMMNQIRDITKQALLKGEDNKNKSDWSIKKNNIRDAIHDYVYENTKRNPMILPIIMEI